MDDDLATPAAGRMRDAPRSSHAVGGRWPGNAAGEATRNCLKGLIDLASRNLRGCAGASCTLWHGPDVACAIATHPELESLLTNQLRRGSGPTPEAVRAGHGVTYADTLGADRRDEFASEALSMGVRCSATAVRRMEAYTVTLTVYGVRPDVLSDDVLDAQSLLAAAVCAVVLSGAQAVREPDRSGSAGPGSRAEKLLEKAAGLLTDGLGRSADAGATRMLLPLSEGSGMSLREAVRALAEAYCEPPRQSF